MVAAVDADAAAARSNAPSARWAARRQRGSWSARAARASAETAVACVMPLIHGGVPPPQAK